MKQLGLLKTIKWSVCNGGRQSIALSPQKTYLPQVFKRFNNPKRVTAVEVSELSSAQIKEKYKESAGYFTVGYATERLKARMSTTSLCVIDGDIGSEGALSKLDTIHRTLRDKFEINHLIHDSFTSGRWRLIVPLASEIRADELEICARGICKKLQDVGCSVEYVKENGVISQPWFFPVVIGEVEYNVKQFLGGELYEFLDTGEAVEKKDNKFDKNYAIEQLLDAQEMHTTVRDLAMSMVSQGIKITYIQLILESALKTVVEKLGEQGNYKRAREAELRIKDIPRMITTASAKINPEIVLPDLTRELVGKTHLSWPPGVMGDLSASMYEKCMYPIKEVAVCAGFGLVAGLGGRTYNVKDSGINLYLTLLMNTGMGKDSIQKFITQALNKLEGHNFLGAKNYTSAKGLLEALRVARSKVCVFTEAGFMYQSTSGAKDDLQRNILDLFSKSGFEDFAGAETYSDIVASIRPVRSPALTIVSESTPAIFNKNMISRDAANTGERARMITFNVDQRKPMPNRDSGVFHIEEDIFGQVREMHLLCKDNQSSDVAKVINIVRPDDHWDISCDYVTRENDAREDGKDLEASCLSRFGEKLNRICGCLAALENPKDPVITQEMTDWALELIEYELSTVYNFMGAESENDFHDQIIAPMIVRILKDDVPYALKDRDLHNKMRFVPRTLLKLMQSSGDVKQYLGYSATIEDVTLILKYFIQFGYIQEPRQIGKKHKVYQINPQFLSMFAK